MYKRILVPVDGSRFSEQILPYVSWLARKTGAELALFRAVDNAEERSSAEGALDRLASGFQAKAICAEGKDVTQTILDEAARVPGTLVAITSHGRSGVMRAVLGSTALNVLRTGKDPIMVFRPRGTEGAQVDGSIERIVVPLDGSELSESILPQAAELTRWIGARLIVVSALDPAPRSALPDIPVSDVMESSYVHSRATQLAERYGIEVGWEVLHGDPSAAIPAFVRGLPSTMLAMTTHGRSALQSALVGSVTAASLREGGVPVFTRMP